MIIPLFRDSFDRCTNSENKPPGRIFFKGPLKGAYNRRGSSREGNLRCQIDWASLIAGSKLTDLLCVTLYLRAMF